MPVPLQAIEAEQNKAKLERLYVQYHGLMYYVAHKVTKNAEDAEDAVQQAFLYIIENMQKVGEVSCGKTRSFVCIIARHEAIDLARKRRTVYELEAADRELAACVPESCGEITEAMTQLPKRYRDILLLRYRDGYSADELAKMLEISLAAVRKLIWRAKCALRKVLMEEAAAHQ